MGHFGKIKKNIYNLLNSNYGRFIGENKEHLLNTKIWVRCFSDHASHSVEHQHVKLHRQASRTIRGREKRIYKISNPKYWPVLMNEERVVQNAEKLSNSLNIDFRCNVWQSGSPKLFKINMSSFAD